jgi:hypothetical protein
MDHLIARVFMAQRVMLDHAIKFCGIHGAPQTIMFAAASQAALQRYLVFQSGMASPDFSGCG